MSKKRWNYGVTMEFKRLVPLGFIRDVTDHPNLMITHIAANFRGVVTLVIASGDLQELTAFSKAYGSDSEISASEIFYRGEG